MGRWSNWTPLYHADGSHLKPSEIPFEGPGTYIIGAARAGGNAHSLYVGSAGSVRTRLYSHARQEENTWRAIERLKESGYRILYSVHSTDTVWEAQRLEQNTLTEWWLYPLNTLGNPTRTGTR